ncbi:PAXNEB-domain-containing protein [Polyplosphaeria fusca]|uniref:Elongator complex protein 4 n=1 Tax=Polyplosphaeria fusca TaxID=682080 RepID=A0A9P4R961_9PLEO|nr:PAXNEB-domain-containing protein [Polyplosphaeria fusca]
MAFRKRNIALSHSGDAQHASPTVPTIQPAHVPGVRPSPIDGRPTTSTGAPSLDAILAGHSGLPLGNSLFLGESGTTDYAGTLLRFYAAEGVVQGHKVHVVGVGEHWGRELPGLAEDRDEARRGKADKEKMKIAWRYEGLGSHGESRASPSPIRTGATQADEASTVFCHTFDLAKRLALPVGAVINYIPTNRSTSSSPFVPILQNVQKQLASSPVASIHRIVIPSLLSPALYPSAASQPQHVLQFLHGLRALLRQYPTRLTVISTLPLTLYPRSTGLVRWMEMLSDGVFELSPFPYDPQQSLSTSGAATQGEERPQGMLAVHKLPVFHEKGGGGGGAEGLGEDLAFTVSRRKFHIAKFSLPPVDGDQEAQQAAVQPTQSESKLPSKADLEF